MTSTRSSRRFPHYAWAWPSGDLDNLLRAVLAPDDEGALHLSRDWLSRHDINDSSSAQLRLLLALVERLGRRLSVEPAYPRLVGLQKKLWSQSLLTRRDMRDALGALAAQKIDVLLINGASRLALDPGTRRGWASADVDIVIRPDDAAAAFSVLVDGGWEPATASGPMRLKARAAAFRTLNFVKGQHGDLNVHQYAYQPAQADASDEERLWANALPSQLDGLDVRLPSPADRIALAIARHASDAHVHSDWMVDIAQLVRTSDVNWEHLLETLVARRILIPAASSLTYLADAGCPVPRDVISALVRRADQEGLIARLQLLECKPRGDVGALTRFLRGAIRPLRTRAGARRAPDDMWRTRRSHALSGSALPLVEVAEVSARSGLLHLTLQTELPAARRRVEFELSTATRHIALLRYRKLFARSGRRELRFSGSLDLAPDEDRLIITATAGRARRTWHDETLTERYRPLPFALISARIDPA